MYIYIYIYIIKFVCRSGVAFPGFFGATEASFQMLSSGLVRLFWVQKTRFLNVLRADFALKFRIYFRMLPSGLVWHFGCPFPTSFKGLFAAMFNTCSLAFQFVLPNANLEAGVAFSGRF